MATVEMSHKSMLMRSIQTAFFMRWMPELPSGSSLMYSCCLLAFVLVLSSSYLEAVRLHHHFVIEPQMGSES